MKDEYSMDLGGAKWTWKELEEKGEIKMFKIYCIYAENSQIINKNYIKIIKQLSLKK